MAVADDLDTCTSTLHLQVAEDVVYTCTYIDIEVDNCN